MPAFKRLHSCSGSVLIRQTHVSAKIKIKSLSTGMSKSWRLKSKDSNLNKSYLSIFIAFQIGAEQHLHNSYWHLLFVDAPRYPRGTTASCQLSSHDAALSLPWNLLRCHESQSPAISQRPGKGPGLSRADPPADWECLSRLYHKVFLVAIPKAAFPTVTFLETTHSWGLHTQAEPQNYQDFACLANDNLRSWLQNLDESLLVLAFSTKQHVYPLGCLSFSQSDLLEEKCQLWKAFSLVH